MIGVNSYLNQISNPRATAWPSPPGQPQKEGAFMGRLSANLGWSASRQKVGTLMSSKSANLRLARMSSAGHAHLESYVGLSPERGRKA